LEAAVSVTFLRLHLLVDEPEGVDMTRNVPQAELVVSMTKVCKGKKATYIVRAMLMSRSQLHPVMIPAAAGGNRIAT
jgi:hypothetical protein